MDLYKAQSTNRRPSFIPNGENLHSPSASEVEVEEISVVEEKVDRLIDCSVKKEELSSVVPEIDSTTPMMKVEEPVSLIGDEELNSGPLRSAEMVLDLSDQAPVLVVEKMDEDSIVDKGLLSVETNCSDAIELNTDREIVGNGGKRGSAESASDEQLDVSVSGPLVLSNDSVKVCETLISVSNESDSVILSRIHHASESTH